MWVRGRGCRWVRLGVPGCFIFLSVGRVDGRVNDSQGDVVCSSIMSVLKISKLW